MSDLESLVRARARAWGMVEWKCVKHHGGSGGGEGLDYVKRNLRLQLIVHRGAECRIGSSRRLGEEALIPWAWALVGSGLIGGADVVKVLRMGAALEVYEEVSFDESVPYVLRFESQLQTLFSPESEDRTYERIDRVAESMVAVIRHLTK